MPTKPEWFTVVVYKGRKRLHKIALPKEAVEAMFQAAFNKVIRMSPDKLGPDAKPAEKRRRKSDRK